MLMVPTCDHGQFDPDAQRHPHIAVPNQYAKVTISAPIGGTNGVIVSGAGETSLSGGTPNSYSGTMTVIGHLRLAEFRH